MILEPEHSVTIARTFEATPADLYAAWTQPELMQLWMAKELDADVRIGGKYRLDNGGAGGVQYVHTGEYYVLDPGSRIVMSFRHISTLPGTYIDEFLDVRFREIDPTHTELTLVNGWDGLGMTEDETAALIAAWNDWLDLLDAALPSFSAS
jgi:uncharacterized protein YndB with AHSA1/START domain